MKPRTDDPVHSEQAHRPTWFMLIVSCGTVLSGFFACVTPFSALATAAALKLSWQDRFVVVGSVWMANQAIGYLFLGYPWTWDSVAWGIAIGLSAGIATLAASSLATARPAPLAVSLPFVAAFAAFELALYSAGIILPGSTGAFSTSIVGHVFLINAVTLCVLMILYQLTVLLGLQSRGDAMVPAGAGPAPVR
jgi:hypothetical protein